jgi:hypothetical protein
MPLHRPIKNSTFIGKGTSLQTEVRAAIAQNVKAKKLIRKERKNESALTKEMEYTFHGYDKWI